MKSSSKCVFCGKGKSEVALLIRQADAAICDECTAACATILGRELPDPTPDLNPLAALEEGGVHSQFEHFDPAEFREMLHQFGPSMIDSSLRQGIWMLWMALPEDQRTPQQLTEIVRERYERILKETCDDIGLFQLGK